MILAVIACATIAVGMIFPKRAAHIPTQTETAKEEHPASTDSVELLKDREIRIAKKSALCDKLEIIKVERQKVSFAVLTVTGSVAARLGNGEARMEDRWNFASPELLTTYVEWLKSGNEVDNAEKQLDKIRKLSENSVKSHREVVSRLRKLADSGTDSPKDLAAAETTTAEAELQGQKEVYKAESEVSIARTNRSSLERQLIQAGLDPDVLEHGKASEVIVVAEVPEARVSDIKQGLSCEARFYGFHNEIFPGKVGKLAPTLSSERRTLRVPFELQDPEDQLKPGMFAEIGLGTNERQAILVSTDGVLHVGRSDYMLVEAGEEKWRVAEVRVGEPHGNKIEILSGIEPGQNVLGNGAILLKPVVTEALQP